MSTALEVANKALQLLALRPIHVLTNDTTEQARVVYDGIHGTVSNLLSQKDWSVNRILKELTGVANDGSYFESYSYVYDIDALTPTFDHLTAVMDTDHCPITEFTQQDPTSGTHVLLANEEKLIISYAQKIVGEAGWLDWFPNWPEYFTNLVAIGLARDVCLRLTKDLQLLQLLERRYNDALTLARGMDIQDNYSREARLSQTSLDAGSGAFVSAHDNHGEI